MQILVLATLIGFVTGSAIAASADLPDERLTNEWHSISPGWKTREPVGFQSLEGSKGGHWKREVRAKGLHYIEEIIFGFHYEEYSGIDAFTGATNCRRQGRMVERRHFGRQSFLYSCRKNKWERQAIVLLDPNPTIAGEYGMIVLSYFIAPQNGITPKSEPAGVRSMLAMLSELQPVGGADTR